MPPATRRRAQPQQLHPSQYIDEASDAEPSNDGDADVDEEELMEDVEGEDEVEEEEEEEVIDPFPPTHAPPLPPGLKEISSLASWTVSSSKPGCSVPQLRSPSTALFWQSDGPQPHLLNIHFFKQVSIVGMRLYLDFEADESYTPTRIAFAAGTGAHDLQEWAEMRLEQPRGWVEVDFSGVGRSAAISSGDDASDEDGTSGAEDDGSEGGEDSDFGSEMGFPGEEEGRRRRRRGGRRTPVLRAFLVQVRILENHQNGKDTHLRGLQIFARDREAGRRRGVKRQDSPKRLVEKFRDAGSLGQGAEGKEAKEGKGGVRRMMLPEWEEVPELR